MNGTEQNPRNDLYTWGNSLYITKQWGETVGLRKLVTHVGERRKQTPTHPAIKTKDLNVKESLQLWEENIGHINTIERNYKTGESICNAYNHK